MTRKNVLALAAAALAAAAVLPAAADDPVKPEGLGAGPHREFGPNTGGPGKRRRDTDSAAPQAPQGSSTGSSATPEDANSEHQRSEDERRATESKEKMKKKPGYRHDVQPPRASGTSFRS
ncbi:MAG: hypothetical protein JO035_11185 [Betaproteobacteria bacterium]|nr:hypothetical protein [Betaproteobacteria bacterium]